MGLIAVAAHLCGSFVSSSNCFLPSPLPLGPQQEWLKRAQRSPTAQGSGSWLEVCAPREDLQQPPAFWSDQLSILFGND